MTKHRRALALAVATTAAITVGCGGSDESSANDVDGPAPTAEASPPSTELADIAVPESTAAPDETTPDPTVPPTDDVSASTTDVAVSDCVALERLALAYAVARRNDVSADPALVATTSAYLDTAARDAAAEVSDDAGLDLVSTARFTRDLASLLDEYGNDLSDVPEGPELEAIQEQVILFESTTLPAIADIVEIDCGTPGTELTALARSLELDEMSTADLLAVPVPSEA